MTDKRWRYGLLFVVAGAFIIGLALHEPIPQDASYHQFADRRTVLGVPNFWNVVSSLPFLAVGIAGLVRLRRGDTPGALPGLYPAYAMFFVGAILISFGSAYYHLDPNDMTLTWDRLPMTLAFIAFAAIVVGEHVSQRVGRRCLPLFVLLGVFSVVYWRFTDLRESGGDLRPYIAVQFLPMALIPLIVLLFPSALSKVWLVWGVLGTYAAAKALEALDERIYAVLRVASGHTLKHLVAAAGMYFVVVALRRRETVTIKNGIAAPG